MHAQLHWWYRGSEGVSWKYAFTRDAGCLVDALAGFSEVHLVTGHSHMNFRLLNGNLREHNIAATSGTWWWTGQIHDDYTINTCLDGSPGGYEVFEVDGRDIRWHYKGIGLEDDYQFRAYDMNEVLKNQRIRSSGDFTPEGTAGGMNDAYGENDILVNIWGWQPDWPARSSGVCASSAKTRCTRLPIRAAPCRSRQPTTPTCGVTAPRGLRRPSVSRSPTRSAAPPRRR